MGTWRRKPDTELAKANSTVAMNLTYLNAMLMPAGQLAAEGAGYGAAPAEAFVAKRGAVLQAALNYGALATAPY